MGIRMGGVVCVGLLAAGLAAVQPDQNDAWVGVWQGELDGQPSAVLTLAEDNGALEGTLVLNGISRDGGHRTSRCGRRMSLMHPRLEGRTFRFN